MAGCMTEAVVATCTKADGLGSQAFQLSVAPDGGAVYTTTQSPGGVTIFQRAPDGTLLQPNGPAGGCITTDGASNGTANRCVNSGNGCAQQLVEHHAQPRRHAGVRRHHQWRPCCTRATRGTGLLTQVDCYIEGADSGGCKGATVSGCCAARSVPGGGEICMANSGRFGFLPA